MPSVGQRERQTQNRVIALLRDNLGYAYLGDCTKREDNRNIERKLLRASLEKRGYPEQLIGRALFELEKAAGDASTSLYDRNHAVHNLLRYGVKVRPEA